MCFPQIHNPSSHEKTLDRPQLKIPAHQSTRTQKTRKTDRYHNLQETKEMQQLNERGVLDGLMEQIEGSSGKTGDFQIKSPDFS